MTGNEICARLRESLDSGISIDKLLTEAVELIHESNDRYHWTGIYELFPDNILRLGPFVGTPTNHVFIAVGEGVCGSAVAERCTKNVPDVTKEPNYLACSSETKSELVVLISKGDHIYGQIDIDSHDIDAFNEDCVSDIEEIANWLAAVYESHSDSRFQTTA